ncbi:hypothetical protein DNTS_028723, partial [Danionella cerebrum]
MAFVVFGVADYLFQREILIRSIQAEEADSQKEVPLVEKPIPDVCDEEDEEVIDSDELPPQLFYAEYDEEEEFSIKAAAAQ